MDFSFTEEQEALRGLARQILTDHVTHERLKKVEADPEWFDRTVWRELATAKLLGLAVPEAYGGSGCGIVELCVLLEAVGHTVAPVPLWPTLALGALPIAEFGTAEQRQRWLPGVVAGDVILTAALVELNADEPTQPATTARRDGAAWRLDGVKVCVPVVHLAQRILVPARTGDGTAGVFLVDPQSRGVKSTRQATTSGEPQFEIELADTAVAAADVLGDPARGVDIIEWTLQRAVVGLCAMQAGVAERALRITAEYTSKREQFGKPLATFQAVAQRAADAYVDVEAMRWTTWQAAWRLAQGLPAAEAVAMAKFWAADGGHRVVSAAQHLHGGIGIDLDYPLHRYFIWSKQIELSLGSATRQLLRLGAAMANAPV